MAHTKSRKDAIEGLLANLGRTFVRIEIDHDQLEDIMSDTALLYAEYSTDGRVPGKIIHTITAAEAAQGRITLPSSVLFIDNISAPRSLGATMGRQDSFVDPRRFGTIMLAGSAGTMFTINASNMNGLEGEAWTYGPELGGNLMSRYALGREHLAMLESFSGGRYHTDYHWNHRSKILSLPWLDDSMEGQTITIHVQNVFDSLYGPAEPIPQYAYYWFDDYVTASAQLEWYINLSKFDNIQLPGGQSLNAAGRIAEVQAQLDALKTQLIEENFTYSQFIVN